MDRELGRREFLGGMAAAGLVYTGAMITAAEKQPEVGDPAGMDRFGGLLSVRGQPTGWFHLEKIKERDILITPEGHGFICLGINHVNTLATDGTLFQRAYGGKWDRAREAILRQMRPWGFNTLGYGAPPEVYREVPHFVGGFLAPLAGTGHYLSSPAQGKGRGFRFPDVFDPQWQQQADAAIRAHCEPLRDDPFLIGFRLHDAPTWDVFKTRALRGTEWVSEIRVVGRAFRAHAPGRLFFGEMFLAGDMPDEVMGAAKDYIDVVMIQQGDELLPLKRPAMSFRKRISVLSGQGIPRLMQVILVLCFTSPTSRTRLQLGGVRVPVHGKTR